MTWRLRTFTDIWQCFPFTTSLLRFARFSSAAERSDPASWSAAVGGASAWTGTRWGLWSTAWYRPESGRNWWRRMAASTWWRRHRTPSLQEAGASKRWWKQNTKHFYFLFVMGAIWYNTTLMSRLHSFVKLNNRTSIYCTKIRDWAAASLKPVRLFKTFLLLLIHWPAGGVSLHTMLP